MRPICKAAENSASITRLARLEIEHLSDLTRSYESVAAFHRLLIRSSRCAALRPTRWPFQNGLQRAVHRAPR